MLAKGGTVDSREPAGTTNEFIDLDCERVDVVGTMVLLESARRAGPRRYRSGEGFGVVSNVAKDKSGTDVDKVMAEAGIVLIDFLGSDTRAESSFDMKGCPASDRLEEPEVETVESEDEEACEG